MQEGGYDLAGLGDCIEALLQPFVDRAARPGGARMDAQPIQRPVLRKCQHRRRRQEEGAGQDGKQRLRHHKRRKRGRYSAVRVVELEEELDAQEGAWPQ